MYIFEIILVFIFRLVWRTAHGVFPNDVFWDSEPVEMEITEIKVTFSIIGVKRKEKPAKTSGTPLKIENKLKQKSKIETEK